MPLPAPTDERRRLMLVTVLVVLGHALLILGLPHWGSTGMPGLGTAALVTRMVAAAPQQTESSTTQAAPEPEPTPVPEPPAEPEPTPVTPIETAPVEPKPESRPVAKPKRPPRKAAAESRQASNASTTTGQTAAAAGTAGTGQDREMSILAMPAPPQFGPFPAPGPIETRPPDGESEAIRASIKSASDAPVLPPHPARITYRVTGQIGTIAIKVPSTLNWRHDGLHYVTDWVFYQVKAGERSWYADGLVTPQGLAPVNTWHRTDRKREMLFDHAGERLRFNDDTPEVALAPGTQDPLSLILQLSMLFNGAPDRYPPGTSISLPVARDGQPASDWRVVVEEEETIEGLGGRPLRTLRLKHHSRQDDDPQMEIWLAPALEHLPARIRTTEANGDVLDHVVHQAYGVKVLPAPSAPPATPATQ